MNVEGVGKIWQQSDLKPIEQKESCSAQDCSAEKPELDADPAVVIECSPIPEAAPTYPCRSAKKPKLPSPDIDGNGAVDATDLVLLIGAWGTDNKKADLDRSGKVDEKDLKLLIASWGKVKQEKPKIDPDFDRDGRLTVNDYMAFMNRLAAQDKRAAVNRDGVLDRKDFRDFRRAFIQQQRGHCGNGPMPVPVDKTLEEQALFG